MKTNSGSVTNLLRKRATQIRSLINTPLQPNPCSWARSFPSPRPSPSGRGRTFGRTSASHHLMVLRDRANGVPSPWGEGQGEGGRDIRTAWIGLKRNRRVNTILLTLFLIALSLFVSEAKEIKLLNVSYDPTREL